MSSANNSLSERVATNPKPADAHQLILVEILNESDGSQFRFISASEIAKLKTEHRVLYSADIDAGSMVRFDPAGEIIDLPEVGTKAFLKGIETALNSMGSSNQQKISKSNQPSEKSRIRSISSYAMDAATDAFFDLMEQNIDHWTYDASSKMLSAIAMKSTTDITAQRREAADIQVKSKKFNLEFRAFFIESLVSFKCNEPVQSKTEQPVLELVSSDMWTNHNIEPLLAREYEGETKVEFSQLNRRLSVILDRSLSPEENVLGPKAIAQTLAQALNECGYSKAQREVLEPIIISDFNNALERLYSKINQIWIDLDILPEAKLEILKSEVA